MILRFWGLESGANMDTCPGKMHVEIRIHSYTAFLVIPDSS